MKFSTVAAASVRFRSTVGCLVAVLLFGTCGIRVASAQVLFSEDFEYAIPVGSTKIDLIGQAGWVGQTVNITEGSYLTGSQVLNGREELGNFYHFASHWLGGFLDPTKVTVMSFDAYATTDPLPSHNTDVGFGNGTSTRIVGWFAAEVGRGVWGWIFDPRFLGDPTLYAAVPGGYDRPVRLQTVLDGPNNQVYGIYDFGDGEVETARYDVTQNSIADLDRVRIFVDYRNSTSTPYGKRYSGLEIDNLIVGIAAPVDDTPPVITADVVGTLGNNPWYVSDVSVTWTVTDEESEVTTTGCEDQGILLDTAGLTFTCTAESAGGSASESLTIKRDATAPAITGSRAPFANPAGWNNTDVTVSFACDDDLSGVSACAGAETLSGEGAGQSSTGAATDLAGNQAETTVGPINIDKTAPVVACLATPSRLWPPNHKMVAVDVVVDVDDGSGFTLLSVTSNEPDNGLGDGDTANDIQGFDVGDADTSGLLRAERSGTGTGRVYSFAYEGVDLAGNAATCSTTVTVPHDQGGNGGGNAGGNGRGNGRGRR